MKRVPHPSGVSILFDAKWHQYKLGNTKLQSVSKLLDKYFPFDEEKILSLVSRKQQVPVAQVKQQWNRQALLGKNVHEYIECKILKKPPPTFVLLMEKLQRDAERRNSEGEAGARMGGSGAADASAATEKTPDAAFTELLHGEEAMYLPVADAAVEKVSASYAVLGVEQVVAAPDWGLAGTIDFIGLNKQDPSRILIGDWKTSGSVTSKFRFGSFETPSESCLRHLPNAKFYRYAMQVIMYGEIVKKEKYFEKGFFDSVLTAAFHEIYGAQASTRGAGGAGGGGSGSGVAGAKRAKRAAGVAAASPSVKEFLAAFHRGDFTLEYGIVQLSKAEEGGVVAEFKRVNEETVLPPDAAEMNFKLLLKKVMAGE